MRILIVEDDPVSRAVLAKILEGMPEHKTTVAVDGEIAWGLLDDPGRSFHVLFLDLDLPKLSGFDILQRVHESPFLKDMHVVLCTGAHDRATVLKAAQFGVVHYIVKPCTDAVVRAKLKQLQDLKA
jgi:two-component system chemotaxis response regulator CheY